MAIRRQLGKACGGVLDGAETNIAVGVVGCRGHIFVAVSVLQREAELAVGQAAAGEALRGSDVNFARSRIAVCESNHRCLRGRIAALVNKGLVTIGTAGDNRGYLKRALRRIALNGNRYRALLRVVGVAIRCRTLLDNRIHIRLASVSLIEYRLGAQRRFHNLFPIVGGGHAYHRAIVRQAKHLCSRLIGRRDLNAELTIGHVAPNQRLGKVQAARRCVVKLGGITVFKASVLRGRRSDQLALAVVAYRNLDSSLVGAVLNTGQVASSFSYFIGERTRMARSILHHIGRERNLAEAKRYHIAVLRIGRLQRYGRHCIAITHRHGRIIVQSADGEVEGIVFNPVAALQDLVQFCVHGIKRNILGTILVYEGNHVAITTVNLGGCRQLAIAIIGNIDSHNMVCPVVVQACSLNVPKPCCLVLNSSIGNYFLNRKLEVLAAISLGKGVSRDLRHHIGNAFGAIIRVGELLVAVSKKSLRSIVFAFNNEVEFSSLHVATGQGLFNLNAVIGAARSVLVGKRHFTIGVGYLGLERAGMVVGHRYLHRLGAAIELHAVSVGSRNRFAIPLRLVHVKGVFARLFEGDLAKLEALHFISLGTRYSSRTGQRHSARRYRILRSFVCSGKLKSEGFAVRHVAARQSLGAVNCCRCRLGVIAVCKLEGSSLNGNAIFQVLSTQHQHLIVVLEGYVDGPNRRVVPNACRIKVRVFKGILHGAPIAAIPDHFHDLVGERLFSLPLAQVAVSICCLRECNGTVRVHGNYRAAVGYTVMYACDFLVVIKLGQRRIGVVRASNHMEHILLKRTCIGRIGILLLSNRRPHNLRGVVFVHECCLGRRRWWLYLLAVVGKQLLHFRSYRQSASMAFVGHRYGNLIQCLRFAYAWVKRAQLCGFMNLVGIHARLGVGDVAEVKRNFSTIRRPFRLHYLHTSHALVCVRWHGDVNRAFGGFQDKRELVGAQPSTPSENLLTVKFILACERT